MTTKLRGEALIRWAIEVCQEYREKQLLITLRQLYYQGVSRKVIPSGQAHYNYLKDTLSAARLAGTFPLWALVDRTRWVRPGAFTRNDVKLERAIDRSVDAVRSIPEQVLFRDRWFGQPNHVSIWYEKDALAGLFEAAAEPLGVSTFSTRGDPSHAALYEWIEKAAAVHGVHNAGGWKDSDDNNHNGKAKRSVILYFGDHDPTGMRIPRTAMETVAAFMRIAGLSFPVEFHRIGITMEQAERLDLPPFPAKQSAGKDFDAYVEEFGTTDAWELDALGPEETIDLVKASVTPYFDEALHAHLQRTVAERREALRVQMRQTGWHTAATTFNQDD